MSKKKKDAPQKPKEQKIIYIDDGSTIADMSGTYKTRDGKAPPRTTFREKMQTFFSVMKKMVLPCLVTLIAFTLVFLLFQCLAGNL